MKIQALVLVLAVAPAAAFTAFNAGKTARVSTSSNPSSTKLFSGPVIGAGGMADTRDPDAKDDEDPRKSISAAPSFEEYMKQRAGATATPAPAPSAVPAPAANVSPAATVPAPTAAVSGGAGSAVSAIASLEASQATIVEKIAAAIPDLERKPAQSWTSETIGGNAATLDARDAPGPANIAWLSSLCVPSKLSSLTIFNGPLNDVPHLLSRCAVIGEDTLSFTLDFRPRAYGAYELSDEDRSPDKLGRKAFEYSGARNDYEKKFGDEEVVAFMESTVASFQGGVRGNAAPTELDQLTCGPLALSVNMPLTDANVAAVAAAREAAANFWLGWALDGAHEHRPGAPVNTQYVYDTKFKQNCYGALLNVYTELFGAEDGAKITAADSGPLDEAYVGGGS